MRPALLAILCSMAIASFAKLNHSCIRSRVSMGINGGMTVNSEPVGILSEGGREEGEHLLVKVVRNAESMPLDVFEVDIESVFGYFQSRLRLLDPHKYPVNEEIPGCGPVFEDYLYPTDSANHVVFVDATEGDPECTGNAFAYSMTCLRLRSGRPYASYIHLCELYSAEQQGEFLGPGERRTILTHEAYHCLGFDEESFSYYPPDDYLSDTKFLTKPKKALHKIHRNDGNIFERRHRYSKTFMKSVEILTSSGPTLIAREHFDCPKLEGVEIDDSHLSKRLYYDAIMSSTLTDGTRHTSDLSLAILEASGWYAADLHEDDTGGFMWGRGKGCDFVQRNCLSYFEETGDESHFCFRTALESCRIYEYPQSVAIPQQMRYFANGQVGGDPSCEYCPINAAWGEESNDTQITSGSTQNGNHLRSLYAIITTLLVLSAIF